MKIIYVKRITMDTFFWWGKMTLIGIVSLFFLLLGIDSLVSSYQSTSPHIFVMGFFSSNLMILISAVGIMYPAVRIYGRYKTSVHEDKENDE